ncbi:unnamed protein product [Vicia faba]|uniref:Hexosyltransferase n=1 Tax=Vicia faba TaxID=3906 RepID=A0AAV0Z0D7_VICFA|nr:unnamed protein product [Vicia faba]
MFQRFILEFSSRQTFRRNPRHFVHQKIPSHLSSRKEFSNASRPSLQKEFSNASRPAGASAPGSTGKPPESHDKYLEKEKLSDPQEVLIDDAIGDLKSGQLTKEELVSPSREKSDNENPAVEHAEQKVDTSLSQPEIIIEEFDHDDETQDQEAQREGLFSMGGDQKTFNTTVMANQNINTTFQRKKVENIIEVTEKQSGLTVSRHRQISHHQSHKVTNQTVIEIKDQIIRARAYLGLSPPSSTSHLVKELKLRIREMERVVGEATKDSDLSRSALQKMRRMEGSLSKDNRAFPDCAAMAAKLRAMNDNAEEQVRSHQHEVTHLVYLAARTTPKGFHYLSMQLTADYFSLRPDDRKLPNENKIHDLELYHYAVFSDNVLACGVVVNSTVSNSKEQEKLVFHIVTNSLNFPSISMWFLLNPPGKAAVHIQNIDNFDWLSKYNTFKKQNARDLRYTSELNYLRFYLEDIFPTLNKILLFDHDVVVQQDLSTLWNINMNEKVIAGVGTYQEGETSFRRMDMFINFSNPYIAKRRWHILGLGYDSDIDTNKIEQAVVIHFDGIRKSWMDIGLARYKSYWSKFINFDLPLLQRCNIQA